MPNKIGRFRLQEELLDYEPEFVMAIMGTCLIYRCEFLYPSKCFEYLAYHEDFEEVPPGQKEPFYTLLVAEAKISSTKTELTVTWEKADHYGT